MDDTILDDNLEECINRESFSLGSTSTEIDLSCSTEKSKAGRKKTVATLILENLQRIRNHKEKPKLEYLRAFFVRLIKKITRTELDNLEIEREHLNKPKKGRKFKSCKYCKHPNIDIASHMRRYIRQFEDELNETGAASTDFDPSNHQLYRSFNAALLQFHFSLSVMSKLHDLFVELMFSGNEQENIESFIGVRVISMNPNLSLEKLKLLLLSDYFKGFPNSEEDLRWQVKEFEIPNRSSQEVEPMEIEITSEIDGISDRDFHQL